jgi:hypothetical protein
MKTTLTERKLEKEKKQQIFQDCLMKYIDTVSLEIRRDEKENNRKERNGYSLLSGNGNHSKIYFLR